MGHHLTPEGGFKSDKYDWCPEGFFPLKFTDPKARGLILQYASSSKDIELMADLRAACTHYAELKGKANEDEDETDVED